MDSSNGNDNDNGNDDDNRESKKRKVDSTNGCCSGDDDDSIDKKPAPMLSSTHASAAIMGETQYVTKEDLEKFLVSIEASILATKKDLEMLERRFNNLVSSTMIAPATLHAKYETCVYSFVDPILSTTTSSCRCNTNEGGNKIKDTVSTTCLEVFEALTTTNNDNMLSPNFQWRGPQQADVVFPLMEAGLKGIHNFIVHSNERDIHALLSSRQNKLVHGDNLLQSIFGSPTDEEEARSDSFEDTKNEIRKFQTTLRRAVVVSSSASSTMAASPPLQVASTTSSSSSSTREFADSIQWLRQALESKNFIINDETERVVVEKLNHLLMVEEDLST